MAINRTKQYEDYKQEPLQQAVTYLWKITNARAIASQTPGNMYVRVRAEVAKGLSKGYVASFPNFTFMTLSHDEATSERYQNNSMDAAFQVLGEFPPAIFPTEEGEETDFTLALEGALFEATAKPSNNIKYWEFDVVYGPPKGKVENENGDEEYRLVEEVVAPLTDEDEIPF